MQGAGKHVVRYQSEGIGRGSKTHMHTNLRAKSYFSPTKDRTVYRMRFAPFADGLFVVGAMLWGSAYLMLLRFVFGCRRNEIKVTIY